MSAKILWASQTGNCEAISQRILEDALSKKIDCQRFCLQELGSDLKLMSNEVIVFIVSSTGDGELPDNGLKFYRWIRAQEGNILAGIRYTILGLGDSNYSTFQGGPKTVERFLQKLGAVEFYSRGEADEQVGLENVVEFWVDGLWDNLKYEVEQLKSKQLFEISVKAEDTKLVQSKILEKRVLSEKNTAKQIVELKLSVDADYIPGTAVFMYPQNAKDRVERLLAYAGLDPNLLISVSDIPKSISHRCKSEVRLSEYFIKFVDIVLPLKSQTATYLAGLLQAQDEKDDLLSCIDNSKLTMPAAYSLECILSQYKSWGAFSIPDFLTHIPILSARNYSISSSPVTSPNAISIVFTITGLCTRYLNAITDFQNHIIEFSLPMTQGSFWEGMNSTERALIICTGTGVSPFKGILEHLVSTQIKPVWVIYGCRNSIPKSAEQNFDHIYQNEINEMVRRCGGKVSVANSKSPIGPKYVQDVIDEQAEEIRQWSSVALLCGSFKTREIDLKLKALNPNFKVFTEEWDN